MQNNVIVATTAGASTSVVGTECALENNILFPYSGAPGTNIVADPQFVNAAGHDYHLLVTSPAVDAAIPTTAFPISSADFDGTTRPQGAQPDIGAFELKP